MGPWREADTFDSRIGKHFAPQRTKATFRIKGMNRDLLVQDIASRYAINPLGSYNLSSKHR